MDSIFVQLATILGLSSLLGYFIVRFRLPLLIAYLICGLVIATASLLNVREAEALHYLPEIGIAFVLFLVGMELDFREVKSLGKPIIIAGSLQIFITTIIGSSVAKLFGFGGIESWYLGIGLSFSSTILVIKLLIDKKDITALYGKLAVGILLLEDLFAIAILLFLTVSSSYLGLGYQQTFPALTLFIKAVLLFGVAFILSKHILSSVFKAVSRQPELLFLTALAWCFIYISFALFLGFSVVIGAFLAGVTLASSPFHYQIQGKVKPLRDFFVTLFFVYLGAQVNFTSIAQAFPLILVFTIYTLIAKPIIFLLVFGAFGFKRHTMFQTSISISHISEFSLILILVGLQKGVTSQAALTAIAMSGVLSMIASSIMISESSKLYRYLKPVVGFFERKDYRNKLEKEKDDLALENHILVVGGHRVGGELVKFFKEEKIPYIVLDFNPNHIKGMMKEDINVVYGDVGDPDILDDLNLGSCRMVISTVQDLTDNLLLAEELKSRGINVPYIVRGATTEEAKILYKAGADLVIIPAVIAGDNLARILKEHLNDADYFKGRARIEQDKLKRKTLAWE